MPSILKGGARIIINAPPRHGKALALDTPIPTPNGWTKIGDLKPGDYVFSEEGKPIKVVAVSPIWKNRSVYRISGKEVEPIIADATHEWKVRLDRKYNPATRNYAARTIRTTEYLANRTSKRRPLIEHAKALQLPEKQLAVHPWMLGFWLGDGSSDSGYVTVGKQDRNYIFKKIQECGYAARFHKDKRNIGVLGLMAGLRALGVLSNKHIPDSYLRASIKQRRALLQGLIDSDGYVSPQGQIEFCSTNEHLAIKTAELVRTLGVKCNIILGRATLKGKDCGPKYRVLFYMKDAASIPRKKDHCKDGKKQTGLYVDVVSSGKADTVCIEVDSPTHLFLAGFSMVPTHNSQYTSHWLPTWYLEHFPNKQIIFCSYGGDYASEWGRSVRDEISMNPKCIGRIRSDSKAVSNWQTVEGGGMKTAGVGGPITGRGADLVIIDDPHKNWAEAMSPQIREMIIDWFKATLYTRLEPNASIILIQTRWHEHDLSGYLLDDHEDDWELLRFPALAEKDDILGRAEGEALCPERYSKKELEKIKRVVGSHVFAGLYQQRPAPLGGNILKKDWFRYWETLPAQFDEMIQSWDLAFKGTGTSYVVGQVWGRKGANYYLVDQIRDKMEFVEQLRQIQVLTKRWPGAVTKVIEDAADAQAVRSTLTNTVPGIVLQHVRGSKEARLAAVAGVFESGNVYLPAKAEWLDDFIFESTNFPGTANDDQVDAMSLALDRLIDDTFDTDIVLPNLGVRANPWEGAYA